MQMIMIDDIKSFGFERDVQKNRVNIIELIGRLSLQSLLREACRELYRPEKQIARARIFMEKQNEKVIQFFERRQESLFLETQGINYSVG